MLELVIRPMADAFMQVGVFVALLAAPYAWARYRWGDGFEAALRSHRRLGPLVAALLTVPPGCGGAIIVVAAYSRGAVSYGAAVSALVATMGDATWVLLAADPVLTLQLKVILVVAGTVTGHVVDALGVAPTLREARRTAQQGPSVATASGPVARTGFPVRATAPAASGVQVRSATEGAYTLPGPVAVQQIGALPAALWFLLGSGLVLSVPVTFRLLDPAEVGRLMLGGVDPYLALGAFGTAVCLIAFVRDGGRGADDDHATAQPVSYAAALRHGGREVAFVTVWVAIAYVVWAVFSAASGFDGSQLPLFGVAGVLVGACVGLIPGCAIQIVFAGIFLSGGMPLSTLAANTVSQDGDALIPMMALEHRSALLATMITTVPALLVGGGILLLS